MDLVSNNVHDLALLAELVAATHLYDGSKIMLFQNNIVPTRLNVIGDFTEATYTGYAQKTITWATVSYAPGSIPEVIGTVTAFRPTGTGTTNTVYGGCVVTGAGALQLAFAAGAPVTMGDVTNYYQPTVRIRWNQGGITAEVI